MAQVCFLTRAGKIPLSSHSILMPLVPWVLDIPEPVVSGTKWLPHQTLDTKNISIDWQELYAIVVACYIWSSVWAQKRIIFYCDNQAVVSIINSKRSKSTRIMDLVRALTLKTMKYNFYFKAVHVPGHSNDIADSISLFRSQFTKELRALLAQGAGINIADYAGHSFRIGAATTAASKGSPHWLIQTLGRWSSDCYLRYIRTPAYVLADVSKRLIAI